jgi:two-component system LytT family response regulator
LDYLLKPASRSRIQLSLQRVRERLLAAEPTPALQEWLAERQSSRRLVVRDGEHITFVPISHISRIESADNYAIIHEEGKTHIIRETLNNLEQRLPNDAFLRISRSAIVHLPFVKQIRHSGLGNYLVVLVDGTELPITRNRPLLKQKLNL